MIFLFFFHEKDEIYIATTAAAAAVPLGTGQLYKPRNENVENTGKIINQYIIII